VGAAPLVKNDQSADALSDAIPDAPVQPHRRRDHPRLDSTISPAAILHGAELCPARAGQMWTLAAAVAPAQDLQLAVAPDRQQTLGVGEEELHFALAAPVMDTPRQSMPGDEFGG